MDKNVLETSRGLEDGLEKQGLGDGFDHVAKGN